LLLKLLPRQGVYSTELMIKEFVERNEVKINRILEVFPGFTVWMIILFPMWASFFWPDLVAYIILIFMSFWLYRSATLAIYTISGYRQMRDAINTDWLELLKREHKVSDKEIDDLHNVIIIPIAHESVAVIRRSVSSLAENTMAGNIHVVLAMEEKFTENHEKAQILTKEYQHHFRSMRAVFHPPGLPGEIPGKASNERWAAIKIKEKLHEEQGIPLESITITSCDSDARFHKRYFEALTYKFLTDHNRYRRFWQSVILEHNNIDKVPSFIRIVSVLGGSYHLFDVSEPRKLFINYSTYSTSLKLLEDTGYWDPDIIPEDWHIFLKSFFSLKGEVEVEPIFLPTTIDAPEATTYIGSLINRYQQCRRHAWGVTLIPYVVIQFFKHPEIPLSLRIIRVYKVIEGQILWSTSWFFVTIAATIPPLVNPSFEQTVLGQNLPRIAGGIMTLSLLTLLITIIVDTKLRPPDLRKTSLWKRPLIYLEWLTLPIATLFMASLPGLHAQTSLMLGRYMNYKVTEKV
jgi:hypothetical protein